LLYASYSPPHLYEDGTDDGQPVVTAPFREPTDGGGIGYTIREHSLAKGDMFYRFPRSGGHWSRAVIRYEWFREAETRLPDWVFEAADRASQGGYKLLMATKTGRSDGGAEPVKYLTEVEGARRRPGASTVVLARRFG
jgi:hypothetical protein